MFGMLMTLVLCLVSIGAGWMAWFMCRGWFGDSHGYKFWPEFISVSFGAAAAMCAFLSLSSRLL